MTAVLISFQLFHILYKSGSKRVQMNVTHQFQQIGIFLAQNRLVAVLEEVAMSSVSAVVPKGITGQKPSHDRGDGNGAGSKQKVKMAWNQRPSIAGCFGFFQDICESSQKIVTVCIVFEYSPFFNPPGHYVVESAWRIYS